MVTVMVAYSIIVLVVVCVPIAIVVVTCVITILLCCASMLGAQHISINRSKLHHDFRDLAHITRDVTLVFLC